MEIIGRYIERSVMQDYVTPPLSALMIKEVPMHVMTAAPLRIG